MAQKQLGNPFMHCPDPPGSSGNVLGVCVSLSPEAGAYVALTLLGSPPASVGLASSQQDGQQSGAPQVTPACPPPPPPPPLPPPQHITDPKPLQVLGKGVSCDGGWWLESSGAMENQRSYQIFLPFAPQIQDPEVQKHATQILWNMLRHEEAELQVRVMPKDPSAPSSFSPPRCGAASKRHFSRIQVQVLAPPASWVTVGQSALPTLQGCSENPKGGRSYVTPP